MKQGFSTTSNEFVLSWILYAILLFAVHTMVGFDLGGRETANITHLQWSLWFLCFPVGNVTFFVELWLIVLLSPSMYEEWLQSLEDKTSQGKLRRLTRMIRAPNPVLVLTVWLFTSIRYLTNADYHKPPGNSFLEIAIVYDIFIVTTIRLAVRICTQKVAKSWSEWRLIVTTSVEYVDDILVWLMTALQHLLRYSTCSQRASHAGFKLGNTNST